MSLVFLNALIKQINQDLYFLKQQKNLTDGFFFEQILISHGKMLINTEKNSMERDYLYISIPSSAGFLIEPSSDGDVLNLYRATKVIQPIQNELKETEIPELFILKSNVVEEFRAIDQDYVRTGNDKTLSVAQMSELLLLLSDSFK